MADPRKVIREAHKDNKVSVDSKKAGKSNLAATNQCPALTNVTSQDQMSAMEGSSSGAKNLPNPVKRRLKALKNLQLKSTIMEAQFYRDVHHIECEYIKMMAPLYEKRQKVIEGTYTVVDSDCDEISSDEEEEQNVLCLMNSLSFEESGPGLPGFWLIVLKNVDMISDMIQPHDEPILMHLNNISVSLTEGINMSFKLEFHFSPNPFFTNDILEKEYFLRCEVSKEDPFTFYGPEIFCCKGCIINWNDGMNPTHVPVQDQVPQTLAPHLENACQILMPVMSFFTFFDPPDPNEDLDDDKKEYLAADFEIGHYMRERIIPKAVLFFTGQATNEMEPESFTGDNEDEYETAGSEDESDGET